MNLIRRTTVYQFTTPWHPVVAGVIHDTEGGTPVTPTANGSWNYLIDRDGTIYHDVDEAEAIAWHVARCDRWRPPWVQHSPYPLSDVNYCTIGIELVSDQAFRDAGVPYTDAQYASLLELVTLLDATHGHIWWVGHGELQADRSDPVAFDWTRAGFEARDVVNGRRFVGAANVTPEPPPAPEEEPVTPEDQASLDLGRAVQASGIPDIPAYTDLTNWASEIYRELLAEQAANADLNARLAAAATNAPPAVVRVLAPAGVDVQVTTTPAAGG